MVVTMDKAKHNKNSYILRNVTKGKSHTFFCFVLLLHLNKHIVEKVQDRNGQFVFFISASVISIVTGDLKVHIK